MGGWVVGWLVGWLILMDGWMDGGREGGRDGWMDDSHFRSSGLTKHKDMHLLVYHGYGSLKWDAKVRKSKK